MSSFNDRVKMVAIADRQWPRHLRIAHYQMRLRNSDGDGQLWRELLKLNGAKTPKAKGKANG